VPDDAEKLEHLNQAIDLYGRGFELKRDYYNGENYAVCLDLRANVLDGTSPEDALYDRLTARKARTKIHEILTAAFADPATDERTDYMWMLATMANVLFASGKDTEAAEYETKFLAQRPPDWAIDSFKGGKDKARAIAAAARG